MTPSRSRTECVLEFQLSCGAAQSRIGFVCFLPTCSMVLSEMVGVRLGESVNELGCTLTCSFSILFFSEAANSLGQVNSELRS